MFSSLTDRFFHGMNKRHTKMIDTGEIKVCLQSSRSKKNSHSKSKTARLFDSLNQTSKRSSLSNVLRVQTQTQADFFNVSHDRFMPPSPSSETESQRSKRKNISRPSSQFSPVATADLQAIIKKHLDKEKDDQENTINTEQIKQLGNVLSIKDKLRRKIQSNAFKRFSNINDQNGNTRSERVDQKNIKQLLSLVQSGEESKPNTITTSKNNFIAPLKQSIDPTVENTREKQSKGKIEIAKQVQPEQKINQHKSEAQQPNHKQQTKKETFKPENPKIPQPEAAGKQWQKVHPANTQQIYAFEPPKLNKAAEDPKPKPTVTNQANNQLNQRQGKSQKTEKLTIFQTAEIEGGFLTQIRSKKDSNEKKKQVPSVKLIEQKNIAKPIAQAKQIQKQKTVNEKKIEKQDNIEDEQIEQIVIDHGAANQQKKGKGNQKDKQKQKQKEKQKEREREREREKEREKQKQKQKEKEKLREKQLAKQKQREREKVIQKMKKEEAQKNDQAQKLKQMEKQKIVQPEPEEEYEYEYQEIVDEVENIFYLISEIGNYSRSEKSFMETIGVKELEGLSFTIRYYMWQQFYYVEDQAIQILKTLKQDLYDIPGDLLKEPEFSQFLAQLIDREEAELKTILKKATKLYEDAKPYLPESQKPLTMTPKQPPLKKCQKILQQQFTQLQKLYRSAVRTNHRSQSDLIQRLCQIIQVFCLLKFLNKQKTKAYIDVKEIDDYHLHYQNNKHLVAL